MKKSFQIAFRSLPAFVGLGFVLVGVRVLRNETRLLIRKLELEEALKAKSGKVRRKYLVEK